MLWNGLGGQRNGGAVVDLSHLTKNLRNLLERLHFSQIPDSTSVRVSARGIDSMRDSREDFFVDVRVLESLQKVWYQDSRTEK